MKKLLTYFLTGLLILVGTFLLAQTTNAQIQAGYQVTTEPNWVNVQVINPLETVPETEISSGIYYQLVDIQIKADSPDDHWYFRAAIKAVTRQGLENASQFSFTFDPSYEKVEFAFHPKSYGMVKRKIGSIKLTSVSYNEKKSWNIIYMMVA